MSPRAIISVACIVCVPSLGCGAEPAGHTGEALGGDAAADAAEAGTSPAIADAAPEAAPEAASPALPDAASVCGEPGAACVDSATCFCGTGAGCAWDNVGCVNGRCAVVFPAADDAGAPEWQCCGGCQMTYDACVAKGQPGCMAAWLQCNAGCGLPNGCPVRCLAE